MLTDMKNIVSIPEAMIPVPNDENRKRIPAKKPGDNDPGREKNIIDRTRVIPAIQFTTRLMAGIELCDM